MAYEIGIAAKQAALDVAKGFKTLSLSTAGEVDHKSERPKVLVCGLAGCAVCKARFPKKQGEQ